MKVAKAFRHLILHVLRLGPFTGLRVLWLKRLGPGREVTIHAPGLAAPITVRTGTSDLAIFDEVVLDQGYGFALDRTPEVILDIGANIGFATLYFKNRFPSARIIAMEPDPENFALLQRNTSGLAEVVLIQAALTGTDGRIALERDGLQPSAFHVRATRSEESGIEAVSMPTLLQRIGEQRVDLLKLDIEGAEKELFEARDTSWMEKVRTIAVELHDRTRPGCGHAFFQAATKERRNYEVHEYLVVATRSDPG